MTWDKHWCLHAALSEVSVLLFPSCRVCRHFTDKHCEQNQLRTNKVHMQRFFASPGCKILKVDAKSRGADGKPREDCAPSLALSRLRVPFLPALPCPEPRSARLKWQWAQQALSFPLTRLTQTYRPLLRFIRMWTLSKEPHTSDGMKAFLSTEGVKKSQL